MHNFKVGDKVTWVYEGAPVPSWTNVVVTEVIEACGTMGGAPALRVDSPVHGIGIIAVSETVRAVTDTPVKVRTLKGYCKAIYDVLKSGEPVQADVLDYACADHTERGITSSSDATGARIRDLRKPIYGGHTIVYNAKAKTYQLILPAVNA